MNKRKFTIALLISAMPFFALAESVGLKLTEADFVSAEKTDLDGKPYLNLKLSKSGKAKFKKVNWDQVDQNVKLEVADTVKNFKLKDRIESDRIQLGPFSVENSNRVKASIDNQ